jgi:hypothetical protein
MKRWLSHILFIFVCLVVLTVPAQAATAGFAGSCLADSSNTHLNCVFNAARSDSNGNPPSSCLSGSPTYTWDWGDNSNPYNTSSSFVSHSYPLPVVSGTQGAPYGYFVSLAVFCPEGSASVTRYICIYGFGVAGCIHTDGNYW